MNLRSLIIQAGLVILSLFLTVGPSLSSAAPRCENVFEVQTSDTPNLISMDETYRGEDKGKYIDPLDKKPWFVRYFNESEKVPYQVFLGKDGTFTTAQGDRVTSTWDSEYLRFEEALFIIDSSGRFFVMPFESRGLYHHSSLSNGEPVLYAGTIAFHSGYLRVLSDKSGHYKPSPEHTIDILQYLQKKGADLSYMKLQGRISLHLNSLHSIDAKEWMPLVLKPQPK